MTSKLDYYEVLFEIKDGTEYATLHADAFRAAMSKRDALLAEVGRLTRADNQWADHVKRLAEERDMLRAEREVWGNIAQERNDLRDEVERLHKEKFKLVEQFATERSTVERLVRATEQWEAENERLRAALLHIIDGVGGPQEIAWNTECPDCIAARDLAFGSAKE